MLTKTPQETWSQFLEFISERCTATEFENWFAPIRVLETVNGQIHLEVPNIFVQEYLLDNYKKDLCAFFPLKASGEPDLVFVLAEVKKKVQQAPATSDSTPEPARPPETHSASSPRSSSTLFTPLPTSLKAPRTNS